MIYDFINSLRCVRNEEESDYRDILKICKGRNTNVALMPAIHWYGGTYNLFDQKAGIDGKNMIWIIPAGQHDYWFLHALRKSIVEFYETDKIDIGSQSHFPHIESEEFEECILLHSDDLQNDSEHVIMGANVILVRLSLSSGQETLLFILLDHQNHCWMEIIEKYRVNLKWFVDSGRGTDNYYTETRLYQLMKQTPYLKLLPSLYFKGLYNKGDIPEGFQFQYAMLSQLDSDGYDEWRYFSAVYDTGWNG